MNRLHGWYCQSAYWKRRLEDEILPWCLAEIDLGTEVLELGPGPGVTTDWLRGHAKRVTSIELDFQSARTLSRRIHGANVRVHCGDARALPYGDRSYSSVVALTMLHHLPSPASQDRLFLEAYRVLAPGGIFAGTDSRPSVLMRAFHVADTLVPVDPATLPARLGSAGFGDVKVETQSGRFRFLARRPSRTK